MGKRTILPVIFLFLVGLTLFYVVYSNLPNSTINKGTKLTGIISTTNNQCIADGVCSIKVDDKWIVAEIGGLRPQNSKPEVVGRLIGISFAGDTQKYVGKKVEVYAKSLGNNTFTIYGSKAFYIKVF